MRACTHKTSISWKYASYEDNSADALLVDVAKSFDCIPQFLFHDVLITCKIRPDLEPAFGHFDSVMVEGLHT